jgi:rod shape-determining protein MreD
MGVLRVVDRGVRSRAVRLVRDVVVASVLVLAAVLLQVAVVVDFGVLGGRPDLVVILVVAIGLLRGPVGGALTGFVAGFLVDALGLGQVGISSLVLVGIGYLVGIWGERMADRAAVRPLVAVAGASVLADLAAVTIAVLIGTGSTLDASMVAAAIVGSMLNVLLAIALFPVVRRLLGRRRRAPETASIAPPEGAVAA